MQELLLELLSNYALVDTTANKNMESMDTESRE